MVMAKSSGLQIFPLLFRDMTFEALPSSLKYMLVRGVFLTVVLLINYNPLLFVHTENQASKYLQFRLSDLLLDDPEAVSTRRKHIGGLVLV